jgi:hypothetical protein
MLRDCAEPAAERASDSRFTAVTRRVFSFPVMLAGMLVVLAVLTVRGRFNDPDMWWHLKTGEIIWNTHSIPRVDTFSYTVAGRPWIAQEWLSQLTIYAAYHFGLYTGLMLWLCLFASLILIAAYALSAVYSGNAKLAFLGALTTWLFSTVGLAIRPHLLGYLLLIAELLIVHLARTRSHKWFFALPPLFTLWINLHSSFFFGLVVLGVYLFCSFWNFRLGLLVCRRWSNHDRKALILVLALSAAALFINPVGPKLVIYPLDVMLNQHVNLFLITEWQQPDFSAGRSLGLLAMAILILVIPLLRRVELRFEELLLWAVTFWFAVRHERMEFLFGIVVAPILSRLLADTWERYQFHRDRILPNAVMLGLIVPVVVFAFPAQENLQHQVEKQNPVKAVEFIKKSGLTGNMLNDYLYGGYLIWAAPEHKVFVDGRADIYDPVGVLAEYGKWNGMVANPAPLLAKYQIRYCVLPHGSALLHMLPLLSGWKVVYQDKFAVVVARNIQRS